MNAAINQLVIIKSLFDEAERQGIFLWIENGWAIDARLGRITREHEDIDIAFAGDKKATYQALIESLGFVQHEITDYGFLSRRGGVLLDSEPCFAKDGEYNFEDFPSGSCPLEKEGVLGGYSFRCVSWSALYFEVLGYIRDIPREQWRDKDLHSLRLIEANLDEDEKQTLRALHRRIA